MSESEEAAIEMLKAAGGCILSSWVSAKTETDVFGFKVPGMRVFKQLEKKGLLFFTEEEPFDLGEGITFTFTPMICLEEK